MRDTITIDVKKFLSARKLIREMDIHYATLHKWIDDGTLPLRIRIGRRMYFAKTDLATSLLAEQMLEAPPVGVNS